MARYALANGSFVIRTTDGASIPNDPANRDHAEYSAWVAGGGVPDPYVAPLPPDPVDNWDLVSLKIAFNHENRIRVLEGKAAITVAQFKTAVKNLLP